MAAFRQAAHGASKRIGSRPRVRSRFTGRSKRKCMKPAHTVLHQDSLRFCDNARAAPPTRFSLRRQRIRSLLEEIRLRRLVAFADEAPWRLTISWPPFWGRDSPKLGAC